jgi:serine/threonine protein kinase
MTLAPGKKLGPYEILSPIGAGGMGEVWKARDTRLGRMVAIKKVKEQHSERFKKEAGTVGESLEKEISFPPKGLHLNSWQSRASDFELGRCSAIYVRIPFSFGPRVRL